MYCTVPARYAADAVCLGRWGKEEPVSPDDIMVFAGTTSQRLAARICEYLHITPGRNETLQFSDGNTFVRVLDNVRGRRVYVVQSTIFPTNDAFMELLFWIDAFKRASAEAVTAVIPYFSYGKGDKKDEPRVSIRARVCADAIEAAGADRVVTMDLHAPQVQGFLPYPRRRPLCPARTVRRDRAEGSAGSRRRVAGRRVRLQGSEVRQAATRTHGDRGQGADQSYRAPR